MAKWPEKWTAFFGGESGFSEQQHHTLGIWFGQYAVKNDILLMVTGVH